MTTDSAPDHVRVVREALTMAARHIYGVAAEALPALDAIEAALRKSEERVARLRQALEPFGSAIVRISISDAEDDERRLVLAEVWSSATICTLGDLRRARAALAKEATDG